MLPHASGGQALDDGAHFGGWIVQQGRRMRLQRVGKRWGRSKQLSGLIDRQSSRRSGAPGPSRKDLRINSKNPTRWRGHEAARDSFIAYMQEFSHIISPPRLIATGRVRSE